MNKGDKVKVKAIVQGITGHKIRSIRRIETNLTGIVVGYSFIKTGKFKDWGNDDYFPYLYQPTFHKVWNVELSTCGNRYLKPVKCLKQDLEKIL